MSTTHPLILVAAGAVTVASLTAIAHFTGLLPGRSASSPTPLAAVPASIAVTTTTLPPPSPAPVVAPASTPESKAPAARTPPSPAKPRETSHAAKVYSTPKREVAIAHDPLPPPGAGQNYPPLPERAFPPPVICAECGTVTAVREITGSGNEGPGVGAVAGGVVGGVIGHQMGRGSGKDAATILGALGGAVAGHQIEKQTRTEKQFQVTVRFDDGRSRTFRDSRAWRSGERVRQTDRGGLAPL